jgi:serine/threonine protein kinase/DNA-binding CsgD family transcriptional regulator
MIGKKLNGRYQVLEHIGEGATSVVYEGKDTLLGRTVALKILHAHVRDTTRKRFFQEAMAAAQLNNTNIMAIYDRGQDDGRDYLVVEYVEGDALTNYVPSAPDVMVDLGAQIARALNYAHDREIIHRDIKPANIMVTPDGHIKIMDLGLALPREAKRVTAPGMVIGTPAYISPEQAKGKELDHRTDIYSLGIVLYEMATGQLPFNADDITALLLQHVQQAPPPPRLYIPDLPAPLEATILKCLEKDRARRFQNGESLAESLMRGLPTPTAPDPDDDSTHPHRLPWAETVQTGRLKPREKQTIQVVIADDHTLLRRTLSNFLQSTGDIVIMAEAGDGETALVQTINHQPDVLLLDLNMPGKTGLDILPDIRRQAPDVKVLVLTGRDDDLYIMRALRLGAHGYVLKSTDEDKLVDSIRQVMNDEMVLGRGVAEKVVGGMLGTSPGQLTEQEMDVLLHVAAGLENEVIGKRLGIGVTKLIEVNASIIDKLQVRDRTGAALKALRTGMILIEDIHELQAKLNS